jgi:RIO-like serine/threonine protein kinase
LSEHNLTPLVADKIFKAYTAIHELGICHGDIRPNNIVVGENNSVWILDFEYARKVRGLRGEVELSGEMNDVRRMLEEIYVAK